MSSINTEADLSTFIITNVLKGTANDLGWTTQVSVQPIIDSTASRLALSGYPYEPQRHLELVARVETWKHVLEEVSLDYDASEAEASLSRSKMHDQVLRNLGVAEKDLVDYLDSLVPVNPVRQLQTRSGSNKATF